MSMMKKAAAAGGGSADVDSELKRVSALTDDKARVAAYNALTVGCVQKKDVAGLSKLALHLVKDEGGKKSFSRNASECLVFMIAEAGRTDGPMKDDNKEVQQLMEAIGKILHENGEEYAYPMMKALGLVAQTYQADGEMKRAAQTLSQFKFENYRTLVVTPIEKLTWHVETAEFWLEEEDMGNSMIAVKKAHPVVSEVKQADPKLIFRFKTCWARVLDAQRAFPDAASKYLDLSQSGTELKYSESDLLQTLENAVTCAILAPPSPVRSRLLGMLMSDARSDKLRNYPMLEKMFKERIVRQADVELFQKLLAPHQNAETGKQIPGKQVRTVLQNSIIEHNIFAASKIYNNITFSELAVLLGIPAKEAEEMASDLIAEGRMKATIDQVDGVVEFEAAADTLHVWDEQITQLCGVVNDVLESVVKKNPQYKLLM